MLEINTMIYSAFVVSDSKMAHVNKQMGRAEQAKINSLNLMENLAEVEYIMSDKTGTMTKNELTLVALCCDADSYFLKGKCFRQDEKGDIVGTEASCGSYVVDKTDFLKCLKLCHDCSLLTYPMADGKTKDVLTGASLDEQCLLKSIQDEKVAEFIFKSSKEIKIRIGEQTLDYDFIFMNEFSSERKLMSVIVRDRQDGKIYVYAKGAENKIMERLSPESAESELKDEVNAQILNFGS